MESWWLAPAGPLCSPSRLMAPRLVGLLLVLWTLRFAGGQSVTHSGLPIVASLANTTGSFSCRITYRYTPEFKHFTVSYYHIDLQGQTSAKTQTSCRPGPGTENQTYTLSCHISPKLPDASATGTYYCCVRWPSSTISGNGTFILVRDTGYQDPPQSFQKPLLLSFTGLLTVLSVLGTALLFWKKKHMLVGEKHPITKCPDPGSASKPTQALSESIYTALQHQETEVYACIESEAHNAPSAQSPSSQAKVHRFEDDSDFNLVYENL